MKCLKSLWISIFCLEGIFLMTFGLKSARNGRSCNSYIRHPESMKDLIKHEFNVIKEFVERKNSAPTSKVLLHTLLDTYLKSFEEGTSLGSQAMVRRAKVNSIVEKLSKMIYNNPLAMYSILRRTSEYLPTTFEVIKKDYNISKDLLDFDLPERGEAEGAMKAILQLQLYYGLEASHLAEGQILGTSTGVKMNAGQCKEMGSYARIRGFYSYAVEWLELSRQKVAGGDNSATSSHLVETELKKAISVHDKFLHSTRDSAMNSVFFTQPIQKWSNYDGKKSMENDTDVEEREGQVCAQHSSSSCDASLLKTRVKRSFSVVKGQRDPKYKHILARELCAGNNFQSEKEKSELFCWYESKMDHFYSMGPVKMEFLSRRPDIVQMYDVIGNTTLNRLKLLSKEKYELRTISGQPVKKVDKGNGKQEKCAKGDEDQSVFIAWLTNSNLKSNRRTWTFSRNIGHMTNLKTDSPSSTEPLKLLSMNFANKLRLQLDSPKGQMIRSSQDGRLATFMFFVEDVENGGATAFPLAGVAARPVKGSAVFWYNLYGNGTQSDYQTIHAECPPITGEKIVATRWIKFRDQFQNLPCPFDQYQRFQIKVNGK